MGPNVKRLIFTKMSQDAIPNGGNVTDGINFLLDREAISASAKRSHEWVTEAISLVRNAADPNPWKNADDEAIAGELLRKIDKRKRGTI